MLNVTSLHSLVAQLGQENSLQFSVVTGEVPGILCQQDGGQSYLYSKILETSLLRNSWNTD